MTTTYAKLSAILIKEYKLTPDQLSLDASLQDLGIDSLGFVELLFTLEDAFNIKLPSDPVGLTRLSDVVDYVDQLIAEQEAPIITQLNSI